jgi:cell surface hyaluronidase
MRGGRGKGLPWRGLGLGGEKGKGREGKGREGKGREGKGREGKGRDGGILEKWGRDKGVGKGETDRAKKDAIGEIRGKQQNETGGPSLV